MTAQNPFLPTDAAPAVSGDNPFLVKADVALSDKLAFASKLGFSDTYRGMKQLFGVDEEQMKADQEQLEAYLADPEDGGSVLAAYTAGLVGDPVGWVIPGMKAKNAYQATKAGMIFGGVSGATGYVPEGMTREEMTLWGIGGGGVLSPALFKFQNTMLPAIKSSYQKNVADKMDKGFQQVGKSLKGKKIPDTLGRNFIDNYGLPEAYVKAKKGQRIDHERYAAKFTDVVKKHATLSPEEDALLYRILTGEESKIPANLADLSKESRKLVDDMGQEMVDLGLLDKSIYLENKGKYLHRTYEKTALPQVKKLVRDERQIKMFGAELMRRGKTETIPADELDVYLEAGYKQVKGIDKRHHTVDVNRDWTKSERKSMGEVVSSAYGLAKTGKLMTNDIASFKFYDTIAKDKNLVWTPANKHERAIGAPEGYKQIPTTQIGGVPKYGNLAGKYVPENIHRDLQSIEKFKVWKDSGIGKVHHQMQTWWKRTKTSLNPVVHMNNVMSNFVLYDLVDANYKHIPSAAREMFTKTGDFKKANELGVFNADLMKQELTGLEVDVFKQYMKHKTGDEISMVGEAWNKTKSFGQYMKKTHLDELYGAEDNVMRLGLFKDRLAKGDSAEDAALFARKYMLDYEIHAPGVKWMRETGWPFISYTYRVAPILAETAYQRPWKLAKWGVILNGVNQLGADVAEGDIEKERKLQAELKQDFEVLGIPGAHTMIKVPRTDKSQYLDVARWVPGGDVLDFSTQGFEIPGVPAPLQPSGGAVGGIAKTLTGFSTFTQKPEPGIGSGVAQEELGGRANLFFSEFFPMYHQASKLKASTATGQHPTKDDYTVGEALLNAVGVKVKEYDMAKNTQRVAYKYLTKASSLQKKIRKMSTDYAGGRIGRDTYLKEIDRLSKELQAIELEANKAIK